jgi:hypothetical protein
MISLGQPKQNRSGMPPRNRMDGAQLNQGTASYMPTGTSSPFKPFDNNAFTALQRQTEGEKRRISLDEYTGVGGNANEYYKLYGGLDNDAFTKAQRETEANKTRISQQDYIRMGGNANEYYKLYGDQAPETTYGGVINQLGKQQQQQNYETAGVDMSLNRIQEYNPYGSSEYVTNPDGSVSRVSSLSEPNQNILNSQFSQEQFKNQLMDQRLQGVAGDLSQDKINEFYGKLGASDLDVNAGRMRAEQSMKDRAYSSLDRRFGQEMEAQKNFLLNRGIAPNTEQWNRAMQEFEGRKANAYADADNQALQAGRDEYGMLNNQNIQNRNQAISEFTGQRGLGLQDIANLASTQKGVINPSFSQNYNVQMPYLDQFTPTVSGLTSQGLQQSQNTFDASRQESQNAFDSSMKDKEFELYKQKVEWDKKNKPAGGGGGGGRGSGGNRQTSSFENQLYNMILQSAFQPQQSSVSPFWGAAATGISGIAGAAANSIFGGK